MSIISVFNNVSIDGFFAESDGKIDFFKRENDVEQDEFTSDSVKSGGMLILGRVTYQLMAGYWPTSQAIESSPRVAEYMNNTPKIVFSRTMDRAEEGPHWKNVRLFDDIRRDEIIELKKEGGIGITILGSGSIVRQLANLGLIDQYQLMIHPLLLGRGKRLLENIKAMNLQLSDSKAFKNGNVLLRYRAGAKT